MISENAAVEEVIDEESVKQAYLNIIILRNKLNTKEECFKFLSSVNLLNSYVKKDYAIDEIKNSYRFKEFLSEAVEDMIIKDIPGIEIYFGKHVVYIRINGYQFSFHHVHETDIIKNYKNTPRNKVQEWSGVRLQPIALFIFKEAMK